MSDKQTLENMQYYEISQFKGNWVLAEVLEHQNPLPTPSNYAETQFCKFMRNLWDRVYLQGARLRTESEVSYFDFCTLLCPKVHCLEKHPRLALSNTHSTIHDFPDCLIFFIKGCRNLQSASLCYFSLVLFTKFSQGNTNRDHPSLPETRWQFNEWTTQCLNTLHPDSIEFLNSWEQCKAILPQRV